MDKAADAKTCPILYPTQIKMSTKLGKLMNAYADRNGKLLAACLYSAPMRREKRAIPC